MIEAFRIKILKVYNNKQEAVIAFNKDKEVVCSVLSRCSIRDMYFTYSDKIVKYCWLDDFIETFRFDRYTYVDLQCKVDDNVLGYKLSRERL